MIAYDGYRISLHTYLILMNSCATALRSIGSDCWQSCDSDIDRCNRIMSYRERVLKWWNPRHWQLKVRYVVFILGFILPSRLDFSCVYMKKVGNIKGIFATQSTNVGRFILCWSQINDRKIRITSHNYHEYSSRLKTKRHFFPMETHRMQIYRFEKRFMIDTVDD